MRVRSSLLIVPLVAILPAAAMAAMATMPAGLNMRLLEYNQPTDRLLPTNQSADIEEHTPAPRVAAALAILQNAVPVGTSRQAAETILHDAGARCRPQGDDMAETCSYSAIETRDDYVDAVRWRIRLTLAKDRVDGLAVDRSWVRN